MTQWSSLTLNFRLAQLMPYAEAKRYAELYGMQQEFQRLQSVVLDETAPFMGFFKKGTDPTRNQAGRRRWRVWGR